MTTTLYCEKCKMASIDKENVDEMTQEHIGCGGKVQEVCSECLGTGEVRTYYRGQDTGYNFVADDLIPCICTKVEHDGDGEDD